MPNEAEYWFTVCEELMAIFDEFGNAVFHTYYCWWLIYFTSSSAYIWSLMMLAFAEVG
jgi:hypothetical protein